MLALLSVLHLPCCTQALADKRFASTVLPAAGRLTWDLCRLLLQCKHQLAARLAYALKRCPVTVVLDTAIAQFLLDS